MAVSPDQQKANRENASHSTGPRTAAGKAVVSRNAVRHGILSQRLVLDDEDPGEFESLVAALVSSLRPVGALEATLVEKAAIALWRQRRLVRAETASITLKRKPGDIADQVSAQLGLYGAGKMTEEDLTTPAADQLAWCRAVLEEYQALPASVDRVDPDALRTAAPLLYEQLAEDAQSERQTIAAFVDDYLGGFNEYVADLVRYCEAQLRKADQQPALLALADAVRAQRSIPGPEARDPLSRYQSMLDNELYRALKALREAQDWRQRTLETDQDDAEVALDERAAA